jgi:hypothetical protein
VASAGGAFPGRKCKQWSATPPSGAKVVRLILESGESVMLRAPTSSWGLGGAEYERNVHRIEQWWLAHRGES